jgi:hypothetical protein
LIETPKGNQSKAIIVQKDGYFIELSRYIIINPEKEERVSVIA